MIKNKNTGIDDINLENPGQNLPTQGTKTKNKKRPNKVSQWLTNKIKAFKEWKRLRQPEEKLHSSIYVINAIKTFLHDPVKRHTDGTLRNPPEYNFNIEGREIPETLLNLLTQNFYNNSRQNYTTEKNFINNRFFVDFCGERDSED